MQIANLLYMTLGGVKKNLYCFTIGATNCSILNVVIHFEFSSTKQLSPFQYSYVCSLNASHVSVAVNICSTTIHTYIGANATYTTIFNRPMS